jgi:NAD-dependent SIR2 family protein deacetylase
MNQPKEIFLKYNSSRDVLFFLGAGASYAEGAPLQNEILSLILNEKDTEIFNSNAGKIFRDFMESNFSTEGSYHPSLESIFGYLDYFISTNSSLGAKYPTETLNEIKQYTIKLIHYVISKKSKPSKHIYDKFWSIVKDSPRNISVITLNYDTLLDDGFSLYPEYGFIDYCLPLMNYDHFEEHHLALEGFNWWINPREPIANWGGNPKPIKLIKIHGSLNWKYCKTCNQVFLTPWNTEIDLNTMGFLRYEYATCANPETKSFKFTCPLDSTNFETLIVPPSHIKQLTHPVINNVMNEAAREIRVAKKIVFIGYSFPEADIHIKALLKRNLCNDTELYVINTNLHDELRSSYKAFGNKTYFIKKSFEDFLSETSGIDRIFNN